MIWIRKEVKGTGIAKNYTLPGIPARREYENMLNLLIDAEKYDSEDNIEIAKSKLKLLHEYIEEQINEKI